MSGQVLSSQYIVSSSRIVRPCSPWGCRWIGHWRTTGSTVCSSVPYSQVVEGATFHLWKQERKRPTPVWRRLSRTHAVLEREIPGGWVPVSGMKARSHAVFSNHSAFHRRSAQSAALLLLSDELMRNECLNLRRRAFALDGQVSAEWSRCPGSMVRRARDSGAPLRRSSAGWMPARIRRLYAGEGNRDPVTIRVWALRHQTGAPYSAVAWTRAKVALATTRCCSNTPTTATAPPQECDAWC